MLKQALLSSFQNESFASFDEKRPWGGFRSWILKEEKEEEEAGWIITFSQPKVRGFEFTL